VRSCATENREVKTVSSEKLWPVSKPYIFTLAAEVV